MSSSQQSYEVIIAIISTSHVSKQALRGHIINKKIKQLVNCGARVSHPALDDSKAFLFHCIRKLGAWNLECSMLQRRHCTFAICTFCWLLRRSLKQGMHRLEFFWVPLYQEWRNCLQFKPQTQALSCSFEFCHSLETELKLGTRYPAILISERDWGIWAGDGSPEAKWAKQPPRGKAEDSSRLQWCSFFVWPYRESFYFADLQEPYGELFNQIHRPKSWEGVTNTCLSLAG